MHKRSSLALAFCLCLGITACSGSEEAIEPADQAAGFTDEQTPAGDIGPEENNGEDEIVDLPGEEETLPTEPETEPQDPLQGVHTFTMESIEGEEIDLSVYRGNVLLVVNLASYCGYTNQYDGLEKLYNNYKDAGFTILGFPANNFGNQEPGSDEEIKDFCDNNFDVTFPLFSKISVTGQDQHPLYTYLTEEHGDVTWNFNKFLIDKEGLPVTRFESAVEPLADVIQDAIVTELELD
jgi:glutathione peroxidase